MIVLGISGRRRDAAAALAIDGKLVAAVNEDSLVRVPRVGYRQAGGFPFAALRSCLDRAGVKIDDVNALAVARSCPEDGIEVRPSVQPFRIARAVRGPADCLAAAVHSRRLFHVDGLRAHATQVSAAAHVDESLIIVLNVDPHPEGAVFLQRGADLARVRPVAGVDRLVCAAQRVAEFLGCGATAPLEALEQLTFGGVPELDAELAEAISWRSESGFAVDTPRLEEILRCAARDTEGSLADPDTPNTRTQERRRAVAASFHAKVTDLVCTMAKTVAKAAGVRVVGVGGSLFTSSTINSALHEVLGGEVYVAPVPEPPGVAIGAALAVGRLPVERPMRALSFGPDFTETQIKFALENSRLDYIYEPNWTRLLGRVSTMLSQGKVVAWFQGAMEFGPRSLGGRSILCDPSHRYARENINRFLKQRAEDHPLAVSMSETAADTCVSPRLRSPFMLFRAAVKEHVRDRVRAALDHSQTFPVHTVTAEQSPPLWDLLEVHRTRTGVPGLINTTLSAPGEPTACTPRDAIRTTFSTAIDALVMGRFLVMKDYWLLRSDADR